MAKPKLFISSTFYDLKYIRAELDQFIESLGYEPIRNEEGDIPYGREDALEEYCYKEIQNIDILVSIVGGRFGSESKRGEKSISHIELKTAVDLNKQVYIFIEKNVLAEYETYLLNKGSEIRFKHVNDERIYKFIEEIKQLPHNNNIKGFETSSDIIGYLQEQLAGLFQRFLQNQARLKEVSLITKLENTAKTLDQLVNYLSEENKENAEEVNRILMINHPLVNALKDALQVKYRFYIEELKDVEELFAARGFKDGIDNKEYWEWYRAHRGINTRIQIAQKLFDNDDKLKFLKKTDWQEDFVMVVEEEDEDDDDLPF